MMTTDPPALYFCLITDTSDPLGLMDNFSDTSLATDGRDIYVGEGETWLSSLTAATFRKGEPGGEFRWDSASGHVYKPVFFRGEIIVVNECGREVSGRMRKPGKWRVGYETYREVVHAFERACQIDVLPDGAPMPPKMRDVVDEQVMADLMEGFRAMMAASTAKGGDPC